MHKRAHRVCNCRHPVHMAILGGSMKFLHWLTKRRWCPLTTPDGKRLLTSKGRSPLGLAFGSLELLQFLVGDRGLDIRLEKNLHYDSLLCHLSVLLQNPPKSDLIPASSPERIKTKQSFSSTGSATSRRSRETSTLEEQNRGGRLSLSTNPEIPPNVDGIAEGRLRTGSF